jgi:hypothetical protein
VGRRAFGLLLAAHGERRADADNVGNARHRHPVASWARSALADVIADEAAAAAHSRASLPAETSIVLLAWHTFDVVAGPLNARAIVRKRSCRSSVTTIGQCRSLSDFTSRGPLLDLRLEQRNVPIDPGVADPVGPCRPGAQ